MKDLHHALRCIILVNLSSFLVWQKVTYTTLIFHYIRCLLLVDLLLKLKPSRIQSIDELLSEASGGIDTATELMIIAEDRYCSLSQWHTSDCSSSESWNHATYLWLTFIDWSLVVRPAECFRRVWHPDIRYRNTSKFKQIILVLLFAWAFAWLVDKSLHQLPEGRDSQENWAHD